MASGLFALLDNIAAIAKMAAASLDDVAGQTAKASAKAAGIVIDDTAVTPKYVVGLTPERELPVIWKITKGSLRNKLIFLLPIALVLGYFAPDFIMPLLMLGGIYLAFEGTEKLVEFFCPMMKKNTAKHRAIRPEKLKQAPWLGPSAPISFFQPKSWRSRSRACRHPASSRKPSFLPQSEY